MSVSLGIDVGDTVAAPCKCVSTVVGTVLLAASGTADAGTTTLVKSWAFKRMCVASASTVTCTGIMYVFHLNSHITDRQQRNHHPTPIITIVT